MEQGVFVGLGSVIGGVAIQTRLIELEILRFVYALGALASGILLAAVVTLVWARSRRWLDGLGEALRGLLATPVLGRRVRGRG